LAYASPREMPNVIRFPTEGGSILIEVDEVAVRSGELIGKVGASEDASPKLLVEASDRLNSALAIVRQTASAFISQVAHLADHPSSVEISFGLKASGEFKAFMIAKGGTEANFNVKLLWEKAEVKEEATPGAERK
jgi:hypothetical protein